MSSDRQPLQEVAIRVTNLHKCFQIYATPGQRLKQFVLPRLRRLLGMPLQNYYREFWALHDIDFEVRRGQTVGIIGRNGSGKSTLLQIICGTLHPTQGHVEVEGRVAALLELGSGFNPEFTDRENVFFKATLIKYRHWSNFGQPRPVWTQRRLGLAAQRALYRPLSPFLAPTGAPVPSAFGGRGRCWPVPGQ